MIKIDKDKYPPDVRYVQVGHLKIGQLKWRVFTQKVIAAFRDNSVQFGDATIKGTFPFSDDYGEDKYREALIKTQGHKCCFCEKPIDNGQIEHFRPKKALQNGRGHAVVRPGYYWLAYDWKNLLLACSVCNSSGHKGNLFPINGTRATTPKCDLELEDKVLIDPSEEDPSNCISFNIEVPVGIDWSGRGNANIDVYDLKDRADLRQPRYDTYKLYKLARAVSNLTTPVPDISQTDIDKAKLRVKYALRKKQPFSGMLRENIKKGLL